MKLSDLAITLEVDPAVLADELEIDGVGMLSEIIEEAAAADDIRASINDADDFAQKQYQQAGKVPLFYNDNIDRPATGTLTQLRTRW